MSDYITNLETNSTYWPVAQKNKDYFICVPEIRLYIFIVNKQETWCKIIKLQSDQKQI